MEATLEIATHFHDGTNLVGAEIAPELNYLWIVYWSKNLKWHSPRKIWKLQRGLTYPIAFEHLTVNFYLLYLTVWRKNFGFTKFWRYWLCNHYLKCSYWQNHDVQSFDSRAPMFTDKWITSELWQKKNNIFWHRKPRNADALVISVETNHLTERCSVTWHRAKWSNFWVRFLAVI